MAMIAPPIAIDVPLRVDEYGKIRVGDSRVLLELVVHAFRQGESAESIVDSFSTLKLADVYAVIAYYLTHQTEVNAYVAEVEAKGERLQKEIEASYTAKDQAFIERLRSIRDKQQRP